MEGGAKREAFQGSGESGGRQNDLTGSEPEKSQEGLPGQGLVGLRWRGSEERREGGRGAG